MTGHIAENRPHKCWVEIDGAALAHNLREVQRAIGPDREIVFVVKSDAYGHGAEHACAVARTVGVQRFGVAQIDEGITLRRAGVDGTILLLHSVLPFEVRDLLRWDIMPTLSSSRHMMSVLEAAESMGSGPLTAQIEVNTGMNRLGFDTDEALATIPPLVNSGRLIIDGLYTHFRAAGPADDGAAAQQASRFKRFTEALETACDGASLGIRHSASSQAVAFCPDTFLDAVRPGIILYGGMNEQPAWFEGAPATRPVMSAWSRVLLVRDVRSGEWIHYGSTYRAERGMKLAVIAVGYTNGYPRSLSNKASALIGGVRAPIVGVVGMDMTIVDISAVTDDVNPGDIACLLGTQANASIDLDELATHADTIPYELATSLGNNNPRIYHPPTAEPDRHDDDSATINATAAADHDT